MFLFYLLFRPVQLNKKRAKIINGFASAFEGSKLLFWLPCREDLEFHLVHSKARFCELMASPFWAETFAKCGSVQMEDVERLAMVCYICYIRFVICVRFEIIRDHFDDQSAVTRD